MHVRARREARKADEDYKTGVKKLENTRLALEERLEHGLRVWEKWEKERGGVVKTGELTGQPWICTHRTVLKQYEDAIAKLAPKLTELQKSTSLSIEAYHPDAEYVSLRSLGADPQSCSTDRGQPHWTIRMSCLVSP